MLKIYNTLSRKIEQFKPITPGQVGVYSCGPTVYDYQHIGHMRRYVGDDVLVRVLKANGYNVKHVMNITDVGHLVSDSDSGEDKMEKGAKKFGMSVWDIAKKFEQQFFDSCKELNITRPNEVMHATDYINEQIQLIKTLEEKGYTYKTPDGIYFDSTRFSNYFTLSRQNPEDLKAGARVDMVEGKKHPTDFALWKFTPSETRRQMEWESPWGIGFPGWHIECSAMAMKALGETIDIHTGGIDHINIHHTNEIAQSEAASGKPFVHFWIHHGFLQVQGEKMSKSLGNFYTVEDIQQHGFHPRTLRYLYLQTHYRQEMNFTWDALRSAETAVHRLIDSISKWESKEGEADAAVVREFMHALNDDLNAPKGLSILWDLVRSDRSMSRKAATVLQLDKILGLDLQQSRDQEVPVKYEIVPEEVQNLVNEREELRKEKKFHLADQLRDKIKKLGYEVIDGEKMTTVEKIKG